jgi:hypothetical protein
MNAKCSLACRCCFASSWRWYSNRFGDARDHAVGKAGALAIADGDPSSSAVATMQSCSAPYSRTTESMLNPRPSRCTPCSAAVLLFSGSGGAAAPHLVEEHRQVIDELERGIAAGSLPPSASTAEGFDRDGNREARRYSWARLETCAFGDNRASNEALNGWARLSKECPRSAGRGGGVTPHAGKDNRRRAPPKTHLKSMAVELKRGSSHSPEGKRGGTG